MIYELCLDLQTRLTALLTGVEEEIGLPNELRFFMPDYQAPKAQPKKKDAQYQPPQNGERPLYYPCVMIRPAHGEYEMSDNQAYLDDKPEVWLWAGIKLEDETLPPSEGTRQVWALLSRLRKYFASENRLYLDRYRCLPKLHWRLGDPDSHLQAHPVYWGVLHLNFLFRQPCAFLTSEDETLLENDDTIYVPSGSVGVGEDVNTRR